MKHAMKTKPEVTPINIGNRHRVTAPSISPPKNQIARRTSELSIHEGEDTKARGLSKNMFTMS